MIPVVISIACYVAALFLLSVEIVHHDNDDDGSAY